MKYEYLKTATSPKILVEAVKLLGTKEIVGKQHNPVILGWAKVLGIDNIYKTDEIPWCGLFIAYVCKVSGLVRNIPIAETLRALAWNDFGTKQTIAMLGDVLTFTRKGGGHVGIYVGEDKDCYHVLGGNQGNAVSVTRIEKTRLSQIRRTAWHIEQPESVKQIFLTTSGTISTNEA